MTCICKYEDLAKKKNRTIGPVAHLSPFILSTHGLVTLWGIVQYGPFRIFLIFYACHTENQQIRIIKGPHCSISDEIFYREVSLPASHYSFVIVDDHDWPTLI